MSFLVRVFFFHFRNLEFSLNLVQKLDLNFSNQRDENLGLVSNFQKSFSGRALDGTPSLKTPWGTSPPGLEWQENWLEVDVNATNINLRQ